MAFIFGSSFEAIIRNKSQTTLLKNSSNVISSYTIKIRWFNFIIFVLWAIAVIKFVYDRNSSADRNIPAVLRYTFFWILFLSCLWVWLSLESEFHHYQWIWVSISTKSLNLHYSGQVTHPHHTEMESMRRSRSSISTLTCQTAKR